MDEHAVSLLVLKQLNEDNEVVTLPRLGQTIKTAADIATIDLLMYVSANSKDDTTLTYLEEHTPNLPSRI